MNQPPEANDLNRLIADENLQEPGALAATLPPPPLQMIVSDAPKLFISKHASGIFWVILALVAAANITIVAVWYFSTPITATGSLLIFGSNPTQAKVQTVSNVLLNNASAEAKSAATDDTDLGDEATQSATNVGNSINENNF